MSKILIVDDDPIIRQLVKNYFTAKGHQVTAAVDGKDGIEKFKAGDFNLLIADLMMPVLHGYQLIDFVRNHVKGKSMPILLLTADRKEPVMETYDRRGYEDDYLAKPFDVPTLEKKVNELLAEAADREV